MRCGTHTGFGETNDKQPRRWGIGKKKETERNHEREEGQLLSIPLNSKPRKQKNKEKKLLTENLLESIVEVDCNELSLGFSNFFLSFFLNDPRA